MQGKKIFIATPCFGGLVTQEYMESVIACTSVLQIPLTLSLLGDDAMISRARNTLLYQFFFRSDASHILFVDADIGFPAEAPARLLAAEKDIVAGLYPLKERFWDEETKAHVGAGESYETASLRYVGETEALRQSKEASSLIRTHYVGTGFMLISRHVVQRMINAYPETMYKRIDAMGETNSNTRYYALFDGSIDEESGTYLSEDYTFCKRWREIGGEVWLDTSFSLTHAGRASFSGRPSLRIGRENR